MNGGRILASLALAFAAGSCVQSGNYGWDLGHWSPPLVAEEQVEAFRGVHEGRIGLTCVRGGEPAVFIETWRPLRPEGPAVPATMTYRIGDAEHTVSGRVGRSRFDLGGDTDLLARLANASSLEALLPVDGGGVYPVTFDVSDFGHALEWVRAECRQL